MRLLLALCLWLGVSAGWADDRLEPSLHIRPNGPEHPQIALTLDACSGSTDRRILDVLIANNIPATLFVTARWLDANPGTIKILLAHSELFELENHGAAHIPPVLGTKKVYGLTPAGTPAAILGEIVDGAAALMRHTGQQSRWYRGAAALYSPAALDLIAGQGMGIAGFSLNADYGASAKAAVAAARIASARDGDVIIAHINQPKRAAGAGIAQGILALKARGYSFVRLDQVQTIGADGRQ